jgi:L-alanine-DL-glutamate epimerase-like enolase superfamily enzyme
MAWAGALVVALVILGYCAYEVVWKANRLRADLARLQALQEQVEQLRHDAHEASTRAAALGVR